MTEQAAPPVVEPVITPDPAPPVVEKAFTQAELDQKINDRLARERKKYSDYDEIKSKAAQLDEIEQANATELEKAVAAAQKLTREQVLRESAEVAAKFAGVAGPAAVVTGTGGHVILLG